MDLIETGRPLDTRDSSIITKIYNTTRGKSSASTQSQLARQHVTPWGTPVGVNTKTMEENAAQADPALAATAGDRELTRHANHFQNDERQLTSDEGTYRCPDVSDKNNHFQNAETDQVDERLKLTSSKINDGVMDFGSPNKEDRPEAKLKMAAGTSRINAGNDIFGEAVPLFKSPPPKADIPFDDHQAVFSGHIKTPAGWTGYTDAGEVRTGGRQFSSARRE